MGLDKDNEDNTRCGHVVPGIQFSAQIQIKIAKRAQRKSFFQPSMLRPLRMEKDVVIEYARTKLSCEPWPRNHRYARPGSIVWECYVIRPVPTAQFADLSNLSSLYNHHLVLVFLHIPFGFHLQD